MPRRFSLTRILLWLAALAVLAVLANSIHLRWTSLSSGDIAPEYVWYYLVPFVTVAVVLFGLSFAGRETRLSAVICLVACVVAVYAAEFYLEYQRYDVRDRVETAAKEVGNTFDPRTVDEVVADMRAKGVDAHPFMRLLNQGGPLMPLANTPDHVIVWCNEVGQYLIFHSDRNGFNNPDTIWDKAPVDVAVVGDSYVQGACAPKNDGMVDRVRKEIPLIANLGIGGNSPQSNLATLIEYAPVLKPKRIVWVHYAGNDLSGMMQEEKNPFFRRYVDDPNFRQDLPAHAGEIKRMMDEFFANKYGGTNRYELTPLQSIGLHKMYFLKFTAVRQGLGTTYWAGDTVDFDLLARVFKRTKALCDSLGAQMTVISLPHVLQSEHELDPSEKRLRKIVLDLGMQYMDAGAEMRRRGGGDTHHYYSFGRYGGHLSAAGNALLADMILQAAGKPPEKR